MDILDGNYLLDRIPINDDQISHNFRKLIAVFPGSQYLQDFKNNFDYHLCSLGTNFCPHFCLPSKNHPTEGECLCEIGHEVKKMGNYSRATTCVKADLSGLVSYNYSSTTISTVHIQIANNNVTAERESGAWVGATVVLSLIVLFLSALVGYVFWYWRKTRSTPLIIIPFTKFRE